jgi:hypothetical protein
MLLPVLLVGVDVLGESEIAQLDVEFQIQNHVQRLKIAVNLGMDEENGNSNMEESWRL